MLQVSGSSVLRWACCAALMAAMIGCGGSGVPVVKVSGKVTYKGAPATLGTVQFQPAAGVSSDLPPATGVINSDGTYTMRTAHGEGVPPGKYSVFVVSMDSIDLSESAQKPKWLIPEKFAKAATSGLTADIDGSKREAVLDWNLE